MRTQGTRVKTGAVKKALIVAAALVLAVAAMMWANRLLDPPYQPPALEAAAVVGVPTPADHMGYGKISAQGGFSFSIAGTMYQQEDGSLLLYFTNPAESDANLMCEISGPDGALVYQSGVLRPGEYVERLSPLIKIPNKAMKIELNVYAFEIDTWYSKGTINLSNILQPY